MRRQFYTSFAGVEIPPANRKEEIGSHESKSGIIETCGGYVDGYEAYAPVSVKSVKVEFDLVDDDKYLLDEKIEAWKSLVALKQKLYRRVGKSLQWAWARLMSVEAETDYEAHWGICNMTLNFEIISPSWYGQPAEEWSYDVGNAWDSGLYFDQSNDYSGNIDANNSGEVAIVNRGNASNTDLTFNFSSADEIPAGLTFTAWGGTPFLLRWTWKINCAIPAYAKVTINSAKKQAYYIKNGVKTSIYKYIVLGDDHNSSSWCDVPPGSTTVFMSVPEGSSGFYLTLEYDFVDKWR